jgi:hypothetical protein
MKFFSPFPWLFILAALLYFIPAIVGRKKRHAIAIFWLNFFLGWTVVGWIAALIWAVMKEPLPGQEIDNQPVQEWVHCPACGKYSRPQAKAVVLAVRRLRGEVMSEITGRFITDLHPNGAVRMVFLATKGGGNERPLLSKSLDAMGGAKSGNNMRTPRWKRAPIKPLRLH